MEPEKPSLQEKDQLGMVLLVLMVAALILGVVVLVGILITISTLGVPASQPRRETTGMPPGAPLSQPAAFNCAEPSLSLGGRTWRIQEAVFTADGILDIPDESAQAAYWISAEETRYVFALSAAPDNLALGSALTAGDLATLSWPDCTMQSFNLNPVESADGYRAGELGGVAGGLLIFIDSPPAGQGFRISGSPLEALVVATDMPAPQAGVLAEISLPRTAISQDGKSLVVSLSMRNYGAAAFTLNTSDVRLVLVGVDTLSPVRASPKLPYKMQPGQSRDFEFIFPRPPGGLVELHIFDVEFDVEEP
jgi:hypothetical protein